MFSIVYSAFGQKYLKEAAISAWSAKRHMPDIPTYLLTNQRIACEYFDEIVLSGTPSALSDADEGKKSKAQAVLGCKAESCLFVDADTYFTDSVHEVFASHIPFDIASCHDTWQFPVIYRLKSRTNRFPSHPQSHPYMNTGVIFFRKTLKVISFLEHWKQECESEPNDQLAFADVVYSSDVRLHTLPSVYNTRAAEPVYLSGRLKILHKLSERDDPHPQLNNAFVADFLSGTYLNRMYSPQDGRLQIVVPYFGIVEENRADHTYQREAERYLYPDIKFFD